MRTLPTLDMTGWEVDDFEVALDGISLMSAAGNGIACQPRAGSEHEYFPGAKFVVSIIENYLDWSESDMIDRLRTISYDDPQDEARRLRMILRFELDEVPLTKLIGLRHVAA